MNAKQLNVFKAIDFLIRIESGPDKGKVYRIQPPKITIGRDPQTCQIVLKDPRASRQQMEIRFLDDIVCIDLSSRQSTLINGKPANKKALKPGDTITFGNTKLQFLTRTNEAAKTQLPGQQGTIKSGAPQKSNNTLRIFLIGILFIGGLLFLLEEAPQAVDEDPLFSQEDMQKQIEESKERTSLIQESKLEKKRLSDKHYIYKVENHFISGFRDFQNGQYSRAIESFGTTIAIDDKHPQAQYYARSARKKRSELIDTHIRDGSKYRDKMMFNRCAAEFEKAIVLINNINSKKYQLAKSQLEECRLLRAGGYQ